MTVQHSSVFKVFLSVLLFSHFSKKKSIFCNLLFFKCLYSPLCHCALMVSDLCAGFWEFHQDEGAAPWRDLCPLTSSTPTTTACSRWSSTWVCHCGSTSQSLALFHFFLLLSFLPRPCISSQAAICFFTRLQTPCVYSTNSVGVTSNCLSDRTLHYRLIGWLASQACYFFFFLFFFLCQQNFQFGGDPIWPVCTVINQADALFKCATGKLGLFVFSA